jgi:ergothioneine biosynthesis protein EgtB
MSRDTDALLARYRQSRAALVAAARPLSAEDMQIQSMPDASPTKWHLAHTTWFYETFVLAEPTFGTYIPFDPAFNYLFNSYYEAFGERHPRPKRGLLSRPSVEEVFRYRSHVENAIAERLLRLGESDFERLRPIIELGINHEQQHLELLFTDIKHALYQNPLKPAYRSPRVSGTPLPPCRNSAEAEFPRHDWVSYDAGLRTIGHGTSNFAFDNETPAHRVFLEAFEIATRPVTCWEYRQFIDDGGYRRPELWLSDGWAAKQSHTWEAPLYWERHEDVWQIFTLEGVKQLNPYEPVCHVGFYEADAYARWADARLPTEQEWEVACADFPVVGNLIETDRLHPAPSTGSQWFGDVWEWTQSPYSPYPGYRPMGEYNGKTLPCNPPKAQVDLAKALSEYNGKFMVNQMVLRGGSCVTPASHIRATYRNFFPPHTRWQFSGFRLARDGR